MAALSVVSQCLSSPWQQAITVRVGEYFAEYLLTHDGRLPSKEAVAAEITRLIDAFFAEKPMVVVPMTKAS
jgi:hypothetical protein